MRTLKGIVLIGATLVSSATFCADLGHESARQMFDEAEALRQTFQKEETLTAISVFIDLRDYWQQAGAPESASRSARQAAVAYEQVGDLEKASSLYTQALSLAEESNNQRLESNIESALGMILALIGSEENAWEKAEEHCNRAIALALENKDKEEHANALNCAGEVQYARGKPAEAADFYAEAEAILRSIGARRSLAHTLLFYGYAKSDLSDFRSAASYYEEALAIWRSLDHDRGEALTVAAIARMYWRQSEYQRAISEFYVAKEMLEKIGDVVNLASSLEGIASVYMDMGEYRNAHTFWSQALDTFEEAGLYNYVPHFYEMLGLAELKLGEADLALSYFERALQLSRQSGNELTEAYALRHLGYAYHALDRFDGALTHFLELLELEIVTRFPRLEADTLSDVAAAYVSLGRYGEALSYLERAMPLHGKTAYRNGEARTLFHAARAHNGLGDPERALEKLEAALKLTESLRNEVVSRDLRASYVASVHQYYRLHIDLLMQSHSIQPSAGFADIAFQASERLRARSLMENLALTGIDLREDVDESLLEEEARLRLSLNDRYRRQAEASSKRAAISNLADDVITFEAEYEHVMAKIHASNPRYAALAAPHPLTLSEVQERVLDSDTLLLEYALGEERSYLWAVSKNGSAVFELPSRRTIDALAQSVYRNLRQPTFGQTLRRDLGRLSEILLDPVRTLIDGKRLVIVADGALQYIPFNSLPIPSSANTAQLPMITEHEIVRIPSASTLSVLRSETQDRPIPKRTLAILADPVFGDDDPRLAALNRGKAPAVDERTSSGRNPVARQPYGRLVGHSSFLSMQPDGMPRVRSDERFVGRLPLTAVEADRVTDAAGETEVLRKVGFEANRTMALNPALGEYRILHFATHAVFNENEPGLSGLILSKFNPQGQPVDGFVRLNDIYNLKLPAELVVLSACDTALGNHVEGEGLVGIVRGFMYAGSKRIVASYWQVADTATAELMGRFYREMLVDGRTPADALRRAQLHLYERRKWRHPYYWAAFSLQGEWRKQEP